jgi:hypothetical protein
MNSNQVAMTSSVEPYTNHSESPCCSELAAAAEIACRPELDESPSNATAVEACNWRDIPLYRQLLLGLLFVGAFLILDGSSTASQGWEGAPPWYLPVGLTLPLLLCGGRRYVPVVLISSLIAAVVNYHRPLLSLCGIPGANAIYLPNAGHSARRRTLRRNFSRRGDPQRSVRNLDPLGGRPDQSIRRSQSNPGLVGQRLACDHRLRSFYVGACSAAGGWLVEFRKPDSPVTGSASSHFGN